LGEPAQSVTSDLDQTRADSPGRSAEDRQ